METYVKHDDYILYNNKNVYICSQKITISLNDNVYIKMRQLLWNENYNDKKYYKNHLSYNKSIDENDPEIDYEIFIKNITYDEPEDYLIKHNMLEFDNIWESFEKLTKDQQQILFLIYKQGYTESEVADIIGMSQQMVNYNKIKAFKALKADLEEEYER